MKRILVTGGTSFIGRNILPLLTRYYDITAPKRDELNFVDKQQVDSYLQGKTFDVLIHLAVPNPSGNPLDSFEHRFEHILRAFLCFENHAHEFKKILYFGSGAEYGKTHDIKMAQENDIGKIIPEDGYGFAKYILNDIVRKSSNIYNLRLFGCYGPTDARTKFIRDAIDSCLKNESIAIRQDCYFDYLYVEDLAEIIHWFIENDLRYHDYNVVTGKAVSLSYIAKIIAGKMGNKNPVKIAKEGLNKEYTASNNRLLAELGDFIFTSLGDGIDKQITWQKDMYEVSTNR
jgi:GDP-L-fucose synthase